MIQAFLELEWIEGESQYDGHQCEIELKAFRWESQPEVPNANCCCKLVIRKPVDLASPRLARICAAGDEIRLATLSALRMGVRRTPDFYRVRLSGLRVVSVAVEAHELDMDSAASAQDRLDEEVAFEFSSAETTWRPISRDGLPDAPVVKSGVPAHPWAPEAGDPAAELLRQALAMGFDIRPPSTQRG